MGVDDQRPGLVPGIGFTWEMLIEIDCIIA